MLKRVIVENGCRSLSLLKRNSKLTPLCKFSPLSALSSKSSLQKSFSTNLKLKEAEKVIVPPAEEKLQTAATSTKTTVGNVISEEEQAKRNTRVRVWLLTVSGLVVAIVIVGGLTRLTESGLSMVEWKPLGHLPPMSKEEWEKEFENYKRFPEYQKKNMGMTVDEFKYIYYYEYYHRMLGRAIGLAFVGPAAYFWSKGYFNRSTKAKVMLIASLIGFQGFMGWYMVKSGLDENHRLMKTYNSIPRVSQYRLASHLGTAFLIYAGLVWTYLDLGKPITSGTIPAPLRRMAPALALLVFVTAMSGAFVAGMDAGLVYNEFPLMGGRLVPQDLLNLKPKFLNFFENSTTVQFQHRVLATLTSIAIIGLYVYARRFGWHALPARARTSLNLLLGVVGIQYALGITTLLTYVPVHMASLHQAGSLTLFTIATWFAHMIRRMPK